MPPEGLPNLTDHSYTKPSTAAERSTTTQQRKQSQIGYSTLSVSDGKELDLYHQMVNPETHLEVSQTVNVLNKLKETVDRARTMAETQLHGYEVPDDFLKISIEKIKPKIKPWEGIHNNEMYLVVGSITAWPMELLCDINV